MSYLGRLQNFWDLGSNSYVQLGATGVWGENDDLLLESRVLALDFSLRHKFSNRGLGRDLQVRGEWYLADKDLPGQDFDGSGGYIQTNYRYNRRWVFGARADIVDGFGNDPEIFQFVPSLTWWQSEWVRIRLQYNYLKPEGSGGNHTVLLQFVWAVGPDKHETY